jgi:hypothetical protein
MTQSHTIRIWIAGDYSDALRCARAFCAKEGACFAVQPVDYVYTGGQEAGVCVTLINYPRFPESGASLHSKAQRLAGLMCSELFQHSYSIEGPGITEWVSHRDEGLSA